MIPVDSNATPWNAPRVANPYELRGAATVVLAALLLATADMSMMSSLLPIVGASFGAETSVPWLISLFMSAMAFSGLAVGALADRHGESQVLTASLVLCVGAALMAALSPTLPVLMLARGLAGIGAGGVIVLSYAALAALFGPERQALVQTLIGFTWGCAAAISPVVAVALARGCGWRSAFAMEVALGLACIGALRLRPFQASTKRGEPLDRIAQTAFATFVLTLMLTLAMVRAAAPAFDLAVSVFVCATALVALIVRARQKPEACPLPLAFFRDPYLLVLTLTVPCASGGLYASVTFVPLALGRRSESALALPVVSAGLGFVVASMSCGWLLRRGGFRTIAVSGAVSMALGARWLGRGLATLSSWELASAEAAIGVGLGCIAVAAVVYAQRVAPPGYLATHTSAIQVLRNVGAAIGVGAFPLLEVVRWGGPHASDPTSRAFSAMSGVLAVCALLACGLPRQPRVASFHANSQS